MSDTLKSFRTLVAEKDTEALDIFLMEFDPDQSNKEEIQEMFHDLSGFQLLQKEAFVSKCHKSLWCTHGLSFEEIKAL